MNTVFEPMYVLKILLQPWSRSYQTLFLRKRRIFPVYTDKLGRFIADAFFPYVTNTKAYQRKSETWKNESLVRLTPGFGDPKVSTHDPKVSTHDPKVGCYPRVEKHCFR